MKALRYSVPMKSSAKPLIAISGIYRAPHPCSAWKYNEFSLNEAYVNQFEKSGAVPCILPYLREENIEDQIAPFSAILIPGGMDFNSTCYHEEKKTYCEAPDPLMDNYQLSLIKTAHKMGKWLFGICRGFQGINIAFGGSLYQDITMERPGSLFHSRKDCPYCPAHKVTIEKDSHLYKIFGKTEIEVNSLHHQGIKTLGKDLRPTAVSEDGIIEAIEAERIIGVQWHPEALDSPFFDYLVETLLKNA